MTVQDMKRVFPETDEKYIEKAVRKFNKQKLTDGETDISWFGKLLIGEILNGSMNKAVNESEQKDEQN